MNLLCAKDMKFVSKRWGWELWIVNNEKYCGKLLFIKQGHFCSMHYHKIKDEVLYVQQGKVEFIYERPKEESHTGQEIVDPIAHVIMTPGQAFHVTPEGKHQMHALEDTLIVEFSTQHFDEDSYRITQELVKSTNLF